MKRDPLRAAANVFGAIAAAFLVFMMLFTTYAVVSRELFDAPVLGVVEIMSFGLVGCVFLALPGVFLRDDNITVDRVDQVAGRRTRQALRMLGLVLALGFLVVALSQMVVPADEMRQSGEVTMTLSFSKVSVVIVRYLARGIPDHDETDLALGAHDAARPDAAGGKDEER